MSAMTDSVIDGASMVLGSRKKIKLPNLLAFCPFFGVAQKVT